VAVTAGPAPAVFALVRAPEVGWGEAEPLLGLAGAGALLIVFFLVRRSARAPLMPLGAWRTPGLAASDPAMRLLGAAWIRAASGGTRRGGPSGPPRRGAGRSVGCPGQSAALKARRRRLLLTTNTEEKAIAAPASMGLSMPEAASGSAATL